jgi:hypothetical protein
MCRIALKLCTHHSFLCTDFNNSINCNPNFKHNHHMPGKVFYKVLFKMKTACLASVPHYLKVLIVVLWTGICLLINGGWRTLAIAAPISQRNRRQGKLNSFFFSKQMDQGSVA